MHRAKFRYCAAIALACAIIFSFLFAVGLFSNIQLKLTDSLYGGKAPLDNIIIVAIDDKSLQELGRWPWGREQFVDAVNFLENAKVVGIDVAFFEKYNDKIDKALAEALKSSGNVVIPVEYASFNEADGRVIGEDLLYPVGELGKHAAGLGYVNVVTDRDGVTRAVNLDISDDYNNFAEVVYNLYWKDDMKPANRFLVNFVGKPGSFTTYSFTDVVNSRIEKEVFDGKLVLIGATAPDLHDDYFVPTSEGKAMPGVEIHANTIQTMITKRFLKNEQNWIVVVSIFAFALLIAFLVHHYPLWLSSAASLLLILAYVFVSVKIFDFGVIMNFVYAPLAILISYVSIMGYSYVSEQKAKKKIMGAFGKYVSPVIVERIMKHPETLNLGGERKNITVLFSDIRGFTTISEKLTPHKLVSLINGYLTAMTSIIIKHNGLVDKFIGDAIMAFWNAPLNQPKHAERACAAALEMLEKLKELQKKWERKKLPRIEIGVGINTGEAVIGNMGSQDRFDYTAMGDNINMGSRLEGLTKQYGVGVIISETTYSKVKKEFAARKLDAVRVKGKTKPIFIYELVCAKNELTNKKADLIRHYESGLKLYFARKWDGAIKEFRNVKDSAAMELILRCKTFKNTPPPNNWDGSWVMKTK